MAELSYELGGLHVREPFSISQLELLEGDDAYSKPVYRFVAVARRVNDDIKIELYVAPEHAHADVLVHVF